LLAEAGLVNAIDSWEKIMRSNIVFTQAAAAAICWVLASPVDASLILTPAGIADGFTLTTFVSGYNGQYGPLAQGILPNGNVVTGSALDRKVYVFTDVDGQTLGGAVNATPYVCQTGNCNYAMATAGGQVYGAQAFGGIYEKFANDGSRTAIPNLVAAGLRGSLGMWGDPVNGHIIAASNRGLVDIDPVSGTFRVVNSGLFPDGVTVSPNGTIAYVENGVIQAYDLGTGTLIRSFPNFGHGPDGTGVISGGKLNGDIIVNNNDGTVGLLDPTKPDGDPNQFIIIATGGTRGDFVSPDLTNGTLFLSQNEQVARLSCGPGCSIGGPPPGVPEPGTLLLLGMGLAGLASIRRRYAQ
jgi:WD40 repeat protein